MNRYQGANSALSFAVLAASVAGLNKWLSDSSSIGDPLYLFRTHIVLVGLWLFIILLKIKFWIDDHAHFGEAVQEKLPIRIVGFVLAAISMVFFGLAGYQISNPVNSAELLLIAILISIGWIAVHLIEITLDKSRRNAEAYISLMREKWLILNVVYCIILASFIGWFEPVIDSQSKLSIVALYIVLLFDWLTSRQTHISPA